MAAYLELGLGHSAECASHHLCAVKEIALCVLCVVDIVVIPGEVASEQLPGHVDGAGCEDGRVVVDVGQLGQHKVQQEHRHGLDLDTQMFNESK